MQEPAYIVKNGQPIPYIPIEVKNARDAYAATLHVLFKHVADFHICVVQTISAKYGICEDDILKTIQESPGFKNMHVDPVLDPLGYLAKTPEVPVVETISNTKPPPVARIKKTKTMAPVVIGTPTETNSSGIEPTKTPRKKIVVQKPSTSLDATSCQINADEVKAKPNAEEVITKAKPNAEEVITKAKPKTNVKANVKAKPNVEEVRPNVEEVRPNAEEVRPNAEEVNIMLAKAEEAPRKIIKKKTPCASSKCASK
jgi:hypothetical protein